jgi:hypothetical protein
MPDDAELLIFDDASDDGTSVVLTVGFVGTSTSG